MSSRRFCRSSVGCRPAARSVSSCSTSSRPVSLSTTQLDTALVHPTPGRPAGHPGQHQPRHHQARGERGDVTHLLHAREVGDGEADVGGRAQIDRREAPRRRARSSGRGPRRGQGTRTGSKPRVDSAAVTDSATREWSDATATLSRDVARDEPPRDAIASSSCLPRSTTSWTVVTPPTVSVRRAASGEGRPTHRKLGRDGGGTGQGREWHDRTSEGVRSGTSDTGRNGPNGPYGPPRSGIASWLDPPTRTKSTTSPTSCASSSGALDLGVNMSVLPALIVRVSAC